MFIHIGNNLTISDKLCVGIFNVETLKMDDTNKWLIEKIDENDKLVVLDTKGNIMTSGVSPFTVIKRESIQKDELIWRREDDKELQC